MSVEASRWYGPDKAEPDQTIAAHLARIQYEDLPKEARESAVRSIMDSFGTVLAGSSAPIVRQLVDMVQDWGGRAQASVLVTGARVPAPHAALANAAMARGRFMDDMEETIGDHPTVAPLYAALAAAELKGGCSGKDLITAVTIASDLLLRVRYALHTEAREFAWCTESFTCLSASIAAGKILGFDADTFLDAMGVAFMQLSSTWLMHQEGAGIHELQHGIGTRNGVIAALLARNGVSGPRHVIEGEYGMVHALNAPEYDRRILLDGLGERYRTVDITLKRFPMAGFVCYAIEGTRDLMRNHTLLASAVRGATVRVNKRAYLRACQPEDIKRRPPTPGHARFSIPYAVAATIVRGDFFIDELSLSSLNDPSILDVAQRVQCVVDPDIDKLGAVVVPLVVELHLTSGESLPLRVDYPRGHPRNPMAISEIAEKSRRCAKYAEPTLDAKSLDEAIALLSQLDKVQNITEVVARLVASQ